MQEEMADVKEKCLLVREQAEKICERFVNAKLDSKKKRGEQQTLGQVIEDACRQLEALNTQITVFSEENKSIRDEMNKINFQNGNLNKKVLYF